jgi:TonB-linked SusC/RagA family outer membrane protein
LLGTSQLWAQNRTISGKVVDEKGNALVGVTISSKNGTAKTTTSVNGTFSITVPSNTKTLEFSYVGYSTVAESIPSSGVINIVLKENSSEIEGVVVTGYSREKKTQFSGAATVLSGKVVETVPVGAFDQALQGRAPGVLVNSGSGQPGTSANITIRGIQSIAGAGTQPLYVVDGIPIAASDFATLNANDFETINVLKDASAAAMYGARGGLGVIAITTKKGKSGAPTFTYRNQFGFTQAPNATNFDLMDTKDMLQYEERLKLSGTPGWDYSKNNPSYALQTPAIQARRDFLLDSLSRINTDYSKVLFRQGFSQTHELSISGGADKTKYFLSFGYFDQNGTDLTSRLKRYTTRLNFEQTHGKLTLQFNSTIGYSITTLSEGEFRGNSARNAFQMSWRAKTYENPYRPDGSLIFGASSNLALTQIGNVIEGIQNTNLERAQIKAVSGLNAIFKLTKEISVRNNVGIDVASERWMRAINPNSYVGSLQTNNSGFLAEAYRLTSQIINTSSINFSKKMNKHDLDAGVYFEAIRGYNKALGFQLFNLDKRLTETGQGAGSLPVGTGQTTYAQPATSAKSGYGIVSYFANLRYTYNSKYTLNASARRDGTSRILNPDNQNINTWSLGATWNAKQEKFVDDLNIFSDLKIRASYGVVPNIGSITTNAYGITGGLISIANYLGPQVPAYGTTTAFAGSSTTGLVPTTTGNPNLKIESIQKFNFGIDAAFWKNRARVSVDIYSNKTIDLFVDQPLSATTGFGGVSIPLNAGIMSNKGVEVAVSVDIIKTRKTDLTFGFNHAINNNLMVDLGAVNEYPQGTGIIRKGLPFGSHYTQNYLGADPATGAPMFKAADGSTTLSTSAPQFADFGTYLPKHVGSFNLDFRYGNFMVSALFTYQNQVYRYNNIENWITRGVAGYQTAVNGSKRLLTDQWQKPGDVKFYQSPAFDRGFNSSDIQDASFIRFRNFNIAYNIPQVNLKGQKLIKSAKFYVQVQNIAIWSPWRGPDPEDSNNISLNEFPNPRIIVAGLDINF